MRFSKMNVQPGRWSTVAVVIAIFTLTTVASAGKVSEPTDQDISDHVDDELMIDHGVSSWKVDVETTDGIVTLKGNVNNILAKERAANIAETVRGVRSVINRIRVSPRLTRTDDEIASDVDLAFVTDPAADSWKINESVSAGVVTLTGKVDSLTEMRLAGTIAKGVRGVTDVINNIEVAYDNDRTDREIKADIEGQLKWSVLLDASLTDVKVENGKVTLTGTVGSAAEKRRATYAAWVAGVNSVDDSKLEVKIWAKDEHRNSKKYRTRSATDIHEAIQDAMAYDPRVMSFNVDVSVYGSSVTLRGTVDNLAAKKAAGQVANNTVGVNHVTNRLKVRPKQPFIDDTIEQNIEAALLRDPYVERFEVTVSVTSGVAYLYGSVDTWFEKSQTETVASRIEGVIDVRNYLTVDDATAYTYDPYVDSYDYDYTYTPDNSSTSSSQTDERIKEEIQDELWWSPFVDSDQVTVEVDAKVATLSGTVDSKSERSAAAKNAYDGGAFWVVNDLEVK